MTFEDMDLDDNEEKMELEEVSPPPDGNSNRTFLIVAAIIGGIMLLALIFLAFYALIYAPQQRDQRATEVAAINAQNTLVAIAAAQTEQAAKITPTPSATPVLATATATATPLLPSPTAATPSPTIDRTATVAALLTEAAASKLTPTPTGLPDTGFADDVGFPGLILAAFLLVVVIFIARRLRTAS